jgi:hypothetical protein
MKVTGNINSFAAWYVKCTAKYLIIIIIHWHYDVHIYKVTQILQYEIWTLCLKKYYLSHLLIVSFILYGWICLFFYWCVSYTIVRNFASKEIKLKCLFNAVLTLNSLFFFFHMLWWINKRNIYSTVCFLGMFAALWCPY